MKVIEVRQSPSGWWVRDGEYLAQWIVGDDSENRAINRAKEALRGLREGGEIHIYSLDGSKRVVDLKRRANPQRG